MSNPNVNKINIRNLTAPEFHLGDLLIKPMKDINPDIHILNNKIYEKYSKMSKEDCLKDTIVYFAWKTIVNITIINILGEGVTGDVYLVYNKDSVFEDLLIRIFNESYCAGKIRLIPLPDDKISQLIMDNPRFKLNDN